MRIGKEVLGKNFNPEGGRKMKFFDPKFGKSLYREARKPAKRVLLALGGVLVAILLAIFFAAISNAESLPPPPPPPPPPVTFSISGTLALGQTGVAKQKWTISKKVLPDADLFGEVRIFRGLDQVNLVGRDFFWIPLPQNPPVLP